MAWPGRDYLDKMQGGRRVRQDDVPITIHGETDRVYLGTRDTVKVREIGGRELTIAKTGSHATVVWNPWVAKANAMPGFRRRRMALDALHRNRQRRGARHRPRPRRASHHDRRHRRRVPSTWGSARGVGTRQSPLDSERPCQIFAAKCHDTCYASAAFVFSAALSPAEGEAHDPARPIVLILLFVSACARICRRAIAPGKPTPPNRRGCPRPSWMRCAMVWPRMERRHSSWCAHDKIVYEWYAKGWGPDKPHGTASLAKALIGGVVSGAGNTGWRSQAG